MYPASPGATKNKATRYRYRSRKKRGEGSGAVFSQVYTFLHQFVKLSLFPDYDPYLMMQTRPGLENNT